METIAYVLTGLQLMQLDRAMIELMPSRIECRLRLPLDSFTFLLVNSSLNCLALCAVVNKGKRLESGQELGIDWGTYCLLNRLCRCIVR